MHKVLGNSYIKQDGVYKFITLKVWGYSTQALQGTIAREPTNGTMNLPSHANQTKIAFGY